MVTGSSSKFSKSYEWQEMAVEALTAGVPVFWSKERGALKQAFVVEVSPSGGKTIFSLKAAKAMIEANLIDKVFWVVPRESIKDGFAKDSSLVPMSEPFQLQRRTTISIDVDLRPKDLSLLRNYHGAVVNYQALGGSSSEDRERARGFMSYFEFLANRGVRLMFVFDEVHHGRTGEGSEDACANEWGKAMDAIRGFAHTIVCMTGTPARSDQKSVPFFNYERVDYFNPATGRPSPAFHVRPDFQFSYRDAIEAGVARKLIFRAQNPVVQFRHGRDGDRQEFHNQLAAVPGNLLGLAKKELFLPRNGHIDDMLRVAMEENRRHRKIGDAEAAILVVVGSTDEGEGYNPLSFVSSRVKALFGERAVAVESKDLTAADAIKAFKESGERWIVAKDMISEGTSIPRIRTVLILRDIKSQVKFEQTVHRATRNRSDEFAQDAIVIFFHLPEMVYFSKLIEDTVRLVVPPEKPACPQCHERLEFRPRGGKPCPFCGYEPAPGPSSPGGEMEFEWLSSTFGDEAINQGGDDFSKYDPISRTLLDKLGQNARYGGRDGINELLRSADQNNLISLSVGQAQSPFTADELIERHWSNGNQCCRDAASIVSRAKNLPLDETIRGMIAQCKRLAGMSKLTKDQVKRDHKDPLEAMRKFEDAARAIFNRAKAGGFNV